MMSWQVPAAVLLTVGLSSAALQLYDSSYPEPVFMLLSGGLMLGAVFMATDMVATPMTSAGLWIYGALIGFLVVVIRIWGGMPEGVMYAILFANATSPLIDTVLQPRVYGTGNSRQGGFAMSRDSGVAPAATPDPVPAPAPTPIWPLYRAMVGVGLACAMLIVFVYQTTAPRIARNQAEALERAIFQVLPETVSTRSFAPEGESFAPADQGATDGFLIHAGYRDDGSLVGVAIEAAGMGYQDTIRTLYGYSLEHDAIIGFRVLESRETPGLGDRIETEDSFLRQLRAPRRATERAGRRAREPHRRGCRGQQDRTLAGRRSIGGHHFLCCRGQPLARQHRKLDRNGRAQRSGVSGRSFRRWLMTSFEEPKVPAADEMLKGLWRENPVFVQVLGMCPVLAVSNSAINALAMGLATTFVLVLSNMLVSSLRDFIPRQVRIATYILIIATFVTVVDYLIQAISLDLHRALGAFISLIVVNCLILGRAEAFASKNTVLRSLLDGLGMGAGFTFGLFTLGRRPRDSRRRLPVRTGPVP